LAFVMLALASPIHAIAAQDSASVAVTRANVRRAPTADVTVVATLKRGTQLAALERSVGGTRIQGVRAAGWIRSDLLHPAARGDTAAAPSPAPTQVSTDDGSERGALRSTDGLVETGGATPPAAASASASAAPSGRSSAAGLDDKDWEYRDPALARRYALVAAGGGHLYAGEHLKGAALLVGSVVVLFNGISRVQCDQGMLLVLHVKCAPVNTALLLGAYVFGFLDADDSANRMHRERARQHAGVRPRVSPVLLTAPDGGRRIGIEAVWSW
jgi:hypothetical protein